MSKHTISPSAVDSINHARSILNYLVGISPCEGSDHRDYGLYLILCQAHDELASAQSMIEGQEAKE